MFTFHSKENVNSVILMRKHAKYYIIIYILLSHIVTIEIRFSVINFFTDGHMKVMRRGHTQVNYVYLNRITILNVLIVASHYSI